MAVHSPLLSVLTHVFTAEVDCDWEHQSLSQFVSLLTIHVHQSELPAINGTDNRTTELVMVVGAHVQYLPDKGVLCVLER